MIKVGERKMVRKNIWIMFLSIISVAIMITTSVSAAINAVTIEDIGEQKNISSSNSEEQMESGRISLEEKAEIETKFDIDTSGLADQIIDTIKDDSNIDTSSETEAVEGVDDSDATEDTTDDTSDPSGNLIWLAIEGDEVSNEDPETQDSDPNGSEFDLGETIVSLPQTDIDEVLIVSSSCLIDKDLAIDSSLALNIVGYAEIDVISGSENFVDGPYFNGLDVFDRLSLAAASTLTMFLVRAIQVLDVVFPIADAIVIATTICAWMIEKVLYMIENGFNWVTIDITIAGFTISNLIRTALEKLINPILEKIVDFLIPIAADSSVDIVNYFQNLATLFLNTDFRELIENLYDSSSSAVYAILLVLQNKDTTQIQTWLEQFVSPATAQILVSLLNSYDGLFVSIRDNIFGKFDAFMTYGRDSTSLRNIHAQIDPNCQVEQGQYVAVIEIKAISAGQVFDTKTIGILYDGSGEDIPSADQDLLMASGSETIIGGAAAQSTTNV